MSKLDEIQARTDAATEGPWEVDRNYPFSSELVGIYATNRKDYVIKADDQDEYPTQGTDAVFIAHAREDVPKLVDALRAVEAVHVNRFHDKYGRTKETPQGNVGGWCNCCGNFYSDYCPTITAIREALS